jgi:hypothetical protein
MKKLIILFKTININNDIYKITNLYCNKFPNIISYFLLEDNEIQDEIILYNNIIKVKLLSDNWNSLLIKVIKAIEYFLKVDYTHVMITNISSFINIPVIYNNLTYDCMAHKGKYIFKNIEYDFPSGAGYILTKKIADEVCNFFIKNNYIINNSFTNEFMLNYPTSDDIFFGYYFYINKIKIKNLDRLDILHENYKFDTNYSHFRIKTNNKYIDYKIFNELYNIIYS